jgi:hypothetical protein
MRLQRPGLFVTGRRNVMSSVFGAVSAEVAA